MSRNWVKRKVDDPDKFHQLIQQTNVDQPAILGVTSGTTGLPKLTVITHRNIISFFHSFGEIFQRFWTHEQRSVCYLNLANIFERCISIYSPLIFELEPHIGENIEYLQETLFEVQPTFFHAIPQIWKKMAGQIVVGIENSSWLKKWIYDCSMKIGWRYMEMKWRCEKIPLILRLLRWVASQICLNHILHYTGLIKTESSLSTGAPLPTQIQRLWQVWGIDLVNFYGAAEVIGVISSQRPGFPKAGNIGKPTAVNEIILDENGEAMVSGPGIFVGYWNDEEKTREIIRDGQLHMDDFLEYAEDGDLKFIERKKDIMITSTGEKISPTLIENAIKSSPYITEAVVFTGGQEFPCALIEIDFNSIAEWARKNKVLYTSLINLVNHPDVYNLIEKEVRRANQNLDRVDRVKKFRIISRELDWEKGEITPTGRIKRHLIYQIFKDLVEEMFQ